MLLGELGHAALVMVDGVDAANTTAQPAVFDPDVTVQQHTAQSTSPGEVTLFDLLGLTLSDLDTEFLRVDDYGISGGRSLTHFYGL